VAAILSPKGTRTEFHVPEKEYEAIERMLASAQWEELKDRLTEEMAAADFWSRPDRFRTLARFALMDRVKAATESANALRGRVARYSRSPRRYSAELSGRFALQLHLVREGIGDALEDAPVELALVIEPAFENADDRQATLAWCRRLLSMYRAWAAKRRMQVVELPGPNKDTAILIVGGFGAHCVLAPEAGLHVFEPFEGAAGRVTARVRIAAVPLGDIPAAKEHKLVIEALEKAPRPSTVARRYREEPPLVRDAGGKWRTGRLDLVLGGAFDLFQASRR
jgi:ATP-dependent Clp protease ATP-binding subunit ClpC